MYSTFEVGLGSNEIQFTIQELIFKLFILYRIKVCPFRQSTPLIIVLTDKSAEVKMKSISL